MTAAILAQAPRQSAILAAVAMLHVGVFIIVAGSKVTGVSDDDWPGPIIEVPLPPPVPEKQLEPSVPEPGEVEFPPVPQPDDNIPRFTEEMSPAETRAHSGAGTPSSGSAASGWDYQPPTLDMRDSRLSALIDSCYPSSARRLGNEGRAQVNLVIDAAGRAVSWSLAAGTGFSRLDSAVDCVVGRLKFQPARRDGRAVVAEVRQAIVFRLN